MRAIVLGGGLVGGVMAKDLVREGNIEVTVADRDEAVLNSLAQKDPIKGVLADLSSAEVIKETIKDFDLVIGAVPGFMGYNMIRSVIEAGKNIADISFAAEDLMEFDGLAKSNGVTAVVDCGVAPGISNLFVGYAASLLDETDRALILVGGLPVVREWPYEYKIVFSPLDVIDEYLRPSRIVENGKIVIRPALSELELVELPGVGTLEAFNTDGLRSLAHTMKIPNMKEKTLRFPGHVEKMRMLRESGFFSDKPVNIKGVEVKPVDLTASLLFPQWELKEGEKEFTVMRIEIEGKKDGRKLLYRYDMLDYFDEVSNMTSMARTTGFPCAAVGKLMMQGKISRKGICPPEYIGQDHEVFHVIVKELEKRGVKLKETVIELD
jgi:lysine 6-dehydrogenase